jgi:hypothetical protein
MDQNQNLFRKKSIERISSPEQLNDYLRVTSPSTWIILIAVIVLLAGLLLWSSVTTIESYVEGSGEVKNGVMTIRFSDQGKAKNVAKDMVVSAGDTQTAVSTVAHDENGLIIATAHTELADGFYSVRVSYNQTQVLSLLFD